MNRYLIILSVCLFFWSGIQAQSPCSSPTNLALGQSTSQSSDQYGSFALSDEAVDGSTNGNLYNYSVTHTQNVLESWWEVDLGAIKQIDEIEIWNRTDCCGNRLQNYYVLVSDVPFVSQNLSPALNQSGVWSQFEASQPSPSSLLALPLGQTGRYVRVQLQGTNFLSLAEVKVMGCDPASGPPPPSASFTASPMSGNAPLLVNFDASASTGQSLSYSWSFGDGNGSLPTSNPTTSHTYVNAGTYTAVLTVTDNVGATDTDSKSIQVTVAGSSGCQSPNNLALGQSTSQSSNIYSNSSLSSAAVDGNMDGNHSNGSVTHTQNELEAWWEVDLGAVKQIEDIEIWNRTDCCGNRLQNYYVLVSDVAFTSQNLATTLNQSGVWSQFEAAQPSPTTTISLPAGQTGRYIRVQLQGTNFLSLAEIKVIGCNENGNLPPSASFSTSTTSGFVPLTVNFDGSSSFDSDGTITAYSWDFGDGNTGSGVNISHTYTGVGSYQARLTVTDNAGASTQTGPTVITANGLSASDQIWLEAECGIKGGAWVSMTDLSASDGEYIVVNAGTNNSANAPTDPSHIVTYHFDALAGSTYKMFARVLATDANSNSFWIRVNAGDWIEWNPIPFSTAFTWQEVIDYPNFSPEITLVNGANIIEVGYREVGTKLDKIYLGLNGTLPTGLGLAANNCQGQICPGAEDETAALMDMYNTMNGPNWTNSTNWGIGCPCANNWYGVTCNSGGQVTELNLKNNNLNGAIPPSIRDILALEWINLNTNQITSIPSEMGLLTSLKELYIVNNQISSLPLGFGNLTTLEMMDIDKNQLSSVPIDFDNLSSLWYLAMNNNAFASLPQEILDLPALTTFGFSGHQLGSIPTGLLNKTSIVFLGYADNNLSAIPAEIDQLVDLNQLYLGGNHISDLPPEFLNLSKLSYLDLSRNRFQTVPDEIINLADLVWLDMKSNLICCYPSNATALCSLGYQNFTGNYASFDNFCTSGSSTCSDPPVFDCGPAPCPQDPLLLATPTLGTNRVINTLYRKPVVVPITDPTGHLARDVHQSIVYMDGLGREIQNTAVRATPFLSDLVSFIAYDEFGRVEKQELPFGKAGNLGGLLLDPIPDQGSFYTSFFPGNGSDNNHLFAETSFEASPLNRVIEQGAPGADWQIGQHSVEQAYLLNGIDEVYDFGIDPVLPFGVTYYPANKLYKQVATDENGSETHVFTDFLGRQILSRVQVDATTWADTYYVYDYFGNVRYVMPPEGLEMIKNSASTAFTQDVLDHWCFQYVYDARQRVVEKKVPGADWIYIIYDKLDRVVGTQDGELRTNNEWLITKYDALSRPIITALYKPTGSQSQIRADIQADLDAWSGPLYDVRSYHLVTDFSGLKWSGYSNLAFPNLSQADIHSYTWYGDYNLDSSPDGLDEYAYQTETEIPGNVATTHLTGFITAVKTRVFEAPAMTPAAAALPSTLLTLTFYDEYGREIQTRSETHKGTDISTHQINFAGEIERTVLSHTGPENPMEIIQNFCYDHQGRLLRTTHQVNGGIEIVLASYHYDELGRQIEKNLHSIDGESSFLQSVDYAYNIRDWMTRINQLEDHGPTVQAGEDVADLFSMQLSYNRDALNFNIGNPSPPLVVDKLYNGNISAMRWQDALDTEQRMYAYRYDDMNRILAADYRTYQPSIDPNGSTVNNHGWINETDLFSTSYSYDLNGNIETLQRWSDDGTGTNFLLDDLSYDYGTPITKTNQLLSVTDAATNAGAITQFTDGSNTGDDYAYDLSGNLAKDRNKGIDTILYNHFNKPILVTFDDGNSIRWAYDASGTKLQQIVDNGGVREITDYLNGFYYKSDHLEYVAHSEGRVLQESLNIFRYEYNHTDHLGNVRLSFSDVDGNHDIDPASEVLQTDHYYPFGMQISGLGFESGVANRFRYNGKELHEELGLGWSDYGARMYDASVARWGGVDALADHPNQIDKSLFAYGWNNPTNLTDPDGNCPWCVTAAIGGVIGGVVAGGVALYKGKSLKEAGIAAAGGAVSGALIGSGVGLVAEGALVGGIATNAAFGFAAGAAQETTTQVLEYNAGLTEKIDTGDIVKNAVIGMVTNVVAGAIAPGISKTISNKAGTTLNSEIQAISSPSNKVFLSGRIATESGHRLSVKEVTSQVKSKVLGQLIDAADNMGKSIARTQLATDVILETTTQELGNKLKETLFDDQKE